MNQLDSPNFYTLKLTEKKLILACLKKDEKAQRDLVHRYSPYLYTIARRYMPDNSSAKDILQESLIKVFKNIHQFNLNQGNLKAWMAKIVVNESIRRRKKYLHNHLNDETAIIIKVEPRVESNLGQEDLIRLIQELPEAYKVVFNLYVIDGYSHDEIAKKLDIAASTSRSNLSRAKSILKKRLSLTEKYQKSWEKIN